MSNVLALDFDGTIAEYHGYVKGYVGAPIKSVINKAFSYQDKGWTLAIFTARTEEIDLLAIHKFCHDNGFEKGIEITNVKRQYFTEFWDDRAKGVLRNVGFITPKRKKTKPVSAVRKILTDAADVYDSRNEEYGDAYKRVHAQVMSALFPDGLTLKGRDSFIRFCLVNAIIGKIARYTTMFDEGGHDDSAVDGAAYMAMLKELDDEIKKAGEC